MVFPVDCMGMPIMAVDVEGNQRPCKNQFGHVNLPTSLSSNAALVYLQRDGRYLNNRDVLRVEWLAMRNEQIEKSVEKEGIQRPIRRKSPTEKDRDKVTAVKQDNNRSKQSPPTPRPVEPSATLPPPPAPPVLPPFPPLNLPFDPSLIPPPPPEFIKQFLENQQSVGGG